LVGSRLGDFVDFNEETITTMRLDVARILISIARKGVIDEIMKIVVMGVHKI
jgi:hypothetical protein